MIVRCRGGVAQDGVPNAAAAGSGGDAGGGAGCAVRPGAELGLIIPPQGAIRVEPIGLDVVAWTRRCTGAQTVERLRLGMELISVVSFLWLDEQGRARRLAPNPRAGELVSKSARHRVRLSVPLVGTVCVTGGDTPEGQTRGLEVFQVLALRKAVGDWAPPE